MNKKHMIFAAAALIAATVSCKQHENNNSDDHDHAHETEAAPAEEEHKHGEDEIIIEPEEAARFGIKTKEITPEPFTSTIRVTGQLVPSTTDPGAISASTSGILTFTTPLSVGSKVSKNQVVAKIAARSASGDNPNAMALAAVSAAKRELDRIRPLLDDGIATMSEYNAALAAYESAKASVSQSSISGNVVSTVNGTVLEVLCVNGQYVETGTMIARVSQNSLVTLRADLPAAQTRYLSSITDALVKSPVTGEWMRISELGGKRVDRSDIPSTGGYTPVIFEFRTSKDFMPGSNVDVELIESTKNDCIVIPRSALIEQGGEYYAFAKTGAHAYVRCRVECGAFSGDYVEILSGIKTGDNIVVEGAQTVKMAETSSVVPEGHSHNH